MKAHLQKITKLAVAKKVHSSEHWIHVAYCGALWVEGHGIYAMIGGVLGVVVFIGIVIGGVEE